MEHSSYPEPAKDFRKRRRERILIAITLLLVVAITSLEVALVRRGGQPVTRSLLAFGFLNVITILLFLLTFLIFRNLTKLFLERRHKVFGSRLRTRLVLTFISLILLPTLFLFFMAWQLISSRVDFSWSREVEGYLDQALDLGRTFSQGMEDKLRACGRLLTLELEGRKLGILQEQEPLKAFLDQRRTTYRLTGLEVLDQGGASLAESYDAAAGSLPALPPQLFGPDSTPRTGIHRQRAPSGELLTLLIPLNDTGDYLVARQLIPKPYLVQVANAERSVRELRQMQFLLKPVRVTHYLTLGIVTLIVIMSAVWLAFYMAREITTPIRQLAEGAIKVAEGDYDFHIDQEGRDEIGFLVQSFNKMTQDLQHSQAQLAAAYRQLSASHAMLSDQKQHMEILLKNVAAGVISIDAQGRITTINDSAAQMLRVRREEVLGQSGRLLLPPGEFNRMAEVIAIARHSPRGAVERSLHLMLPDQTLYLLVKPTVLKDDAGGDLGVVIVFEDLTELERAQRLAAWREVARRIAHEVKNPLTPIKLAAQRLRRRYLDRLTQDGQVLDECTRIIISEADGLKELVDEFSRFARLPQLTLAPQDLNSLIRETLLLYREAQPRVTLEFEPDEQLPPLLVDREQIKRVLLNLLDNALASIKDTGKITVSLQGDEQQQRVTLTVADTGGGIPERDKVRIFEPYFSTKRGGTGLGLAIVNSIVAEHQGDIRVEDNLPHGTRFIIELPLHRG